MTSSGVQKFSLSYEISPIQLTGGILVNMPSSSIPIIALTDSVAFDQGLLDSSDPTFDLNDAFAKYTVLTGGSLVENDFGNYPFANQQVAANAVIRQPLVISLLMKCPCKKAGDYANKLNVLTALKATLDQHNNMGGTYTVATPAFTYTNCLLRRLVDASSGESQQPQFQFQWDFEQPLLTLQQAQQAYSALLNQISSGAQVQGGADPPAWTGLSTQVGNPSANTSPSIVPAGSGASAAGVSGPNPNSPTSGVQTTQ